MLNPLASLGQTYSISTQEERQRQVKNASNLLNDSTSFTAGPRKPDFQRKPNGRRTSQLFRDCCQREGFTQRVSVTSFTGILTNNHSRQKEEGLLIMLGKMQKIKLRSLELLAQAQIAQTSQPVILS